MWVKNRQLFLGFAFGVVCTVVFSFLYSLSTGSRYSNYWDVRAVGERTYERMKAEEEAKKLKR